METFDNDLYPVEKLLSLVEWIFTDSNDMWRESDFKASSPKSKPYSILKCIFIQVSIESVVQTWF